LRWFASGAAAFREALEEAERRGCAESAKVGAAVAGIIARVRDEGDAALVRYTKRFDGFDLRERGFAASSEEIEGAWGRTPADLREALERAAARIDAFHQRQREEGFTVDLSGSVVGQRVLPVSRAGIYVPGGKAAYPSTLLMNAIPARVAGVGEIAAACAAPGGEIPDIVLAAARVAGLAGVFRIGGAQAIAAFAFGTESVPKVDVVAGPGNAFVTEAKRQVYGVVGIDMLAGPSELVVLADRTADPAYVAADLLSQAEHDEDAFVALVTDSEALKDAVEVMLRAQAARLPRQEILAASLLRAVGFLVSGREEGIATVNRLAPEHLSIMTDDPWGALEGIRNAGTVFLGPHSPVAVGDYIAGINHTLPTGGAARFSSPLGVGTFLKRTNVVSYQLRLLAEDAPHVVALARKEGLIAHAQAVLARTGPEEG
jgi:histidinol dehydrogenase